MIIFDDCDIEKALFWAVAGITAGTGQVCAATSRIFIQDTIKDGFLATLKERFEAIPLGQDPQDVSSFFGPVVDKSQYDRVTGYIQAGKKGGTKTLTKTGGDYTGKGYYVAPTIFVDPDDDAAIYREEIFGPVLCAKTFTSEEDAIRMANDTSYGLSGQHLNSDALWSC